MAIMTRVSRLLRADLHAMLDRLEAPELVLAQALRDMEQAQALDSAKLKRLEHEHARLEQLSTEVEQRLEQERLALEDCLAAERDDLARAVLRRRLEAEQTLSRLQQQGQENRRARAHTQACLVEQEHRLNELRARAAVFETDEVGGVASEACATSADMGLGSTVTVRDAEIEIALVQAKRQREIAA
ncbi:PspA/IM30 family protein [Rhabdochromatium marinum]|uniref:PspA/IM30 family protein n=1 Tax=Rhabdochromatium marinum TaxID=48729 RepID=UPI0019055522|nr:PspA/IM30 family protein [Rhabdochromatium marinum]MBK1647210.1 hypothetical protein [Rhabdochromatium marinum]